MHNIKIQKMRQPYTWFTSFMRLHPTSFCQSFYKFFHKGGTMMQLIHFNSIQPRNKASAVEICISQSPKGMFMARLYTISQHTHDTTLSENELMTNHHELVYKEKGKLRLYNNMLLLPMIPSRSERTPNFIIYV